MSRAIRLGICLGILLLLASDIVSAQAATANNEISNVEDGCSQDQFEKAAVKFQERRFHGSPELLLSTLVKQCPDAQWVSQASEYLTIVEEEQAERLFQIATYYQKQHEERQRGLAGAKSRYELILKRYPKFSQTDRVLLNVGKAYAESDDIEATRQTFVRLINEFPQSQYLSEAYEQLSAVGLGKSGTADLR